MAQATSQLSLAKLPGWGKLALGAFFMLALFGIYWVVFYSDISAKRTTADGDKTRLAGELSTQSATKASFMKDKADLATMQLHQKDLNKALPENTEAPAFLSALQQVANVSGVDLIGWQPEDEQTQSFYAKFPMKLEMSGKFHQLAKFAYEAGRVERIINVENLEMSDPKVEGDEVKLKAKCVATTFHAVKPKPATSGAPGAPAPPPTATGAPR